jgi:hypothetical protein
VTSAFPPILARLVPRLDSPHDGEIIATAKAIERVLHSSSMDWHDLTKAITAPPPIPWQPNRTESHESAEMRTWLEAISRETWLNDWSRSFIANILARRSLDSLSVKQRTCVDRIIKQAFDRGVRADRRAA